MILLRLVLLASLGSALSVTAESADLPSYMKAEHSRIAKRWLSERKQYRVATDEDCRCEETIGLQRRGYGEAWKPNPDFHPYYVVGDFNLDGKQDFAVGIIGKHSGEFSILIFHGPFTENASYKPAHFGGAYPLGYGMFYGPPRPAPYSLLVGPFEAEGVILKSTAKGYVETFPEYK